MKMKKYVKYFLTLMKHKCYVTFECFKQGLYWRGLTHDISKFLPDEFIPYARYFYGDNKCEIIKTDFDAAWLKHIHRNPHHWQHWILVNDNDKGNMTEKNLAPIERSKYISGFNIPVDDKRLIFGHRHEDGSGYKIFVPEQLREIICQYLNKSNYVNHTKLLDMPDKYIKEMVCDWVGAGKVYNPDSNVRKWYKNNCYNIQLSEYSRGKLASLIYLLEEKRK